MDATRKMTVMPADHLGFRTKGRLAVGADADVAVFDPARVTDRATFENPAQYSTGMVYVLVKSGASGDPDSRWGASRDRLWQSP